MVSLIVGLSIGRFTAPAVVTEKRVEVEKWRDLDVLRYVETKAAETVKVETRVVYRDRIKYRDGTERVIEIEKADTGEHSKESSSAAAERVVYREVEKRVEVEKRIEVRLNWRVGALVGASLREPVLQLAGPLVLGVQAERRIVGGLSVGLWVNTSGAAGALVSLEF